MKLILVFLKLTAGEILAILAFLATLVADRLRLDRLISKMKVKIEEMSKDIDQNIEAERKNSDLLQTLAQDFRELRSDMRHIASNSDRQEKQLEKLNDQLSKFLREYRKNNKN